jgi:hypothetical protein
MRTNGFRWRLALVIFGFCAVSLCKADGPYHFIKEIPIGGEGGWDYLSLDSAGQRLYVSHGTEIVVIDLNNDKIVGEITNMPGVHGIVLAPELGLGITSIGRESKAGIVDLKTLPDARQIGYRRRTGQLRLQFRGKGSVFILRTRKCGHGR